MEPGRGISTKTASEIALKLTNSIIEPIASQIDPLLLGRVERSMRVAEAYSQRLNPNFRHIKKLVGEYPSHEFVIDVEEAEKLFNSVRRINALEAELEESLRDVSLIPHQASYIFTLSTPLPPPPPPLASNEPIVSPQDNSIVPQTAGGPNGSAKPKPIRRRRQSVSRNNPPAITG